MKKIISFSLWGNDKKYLIGALENIKLQKQLFPKWTCRFYVHNEVPKEYKIKLMETEGCEVVQKTGDLGSHMDKPGMFWRFEVLKDKDVERFIARDVDSRLSLRDRSCVLDWIASKKEFHIIRDHAMHGTRIMGGMWGATQNFINRINYDELIDKFSKLEYKNMYATDQEFLGRMIYPLLFAYDVCIHDNFDRFKEDARKIPHISMNGEYIGMPVEVE